MKILYVTTIAATMDFFPEHIKMLRKEGHTVELLSNMELPVSPEIEALNCPLHHIPFSRSPLSGDNIRAYGELKKLLESGKYDIVHTHTPNASVLVRLACRGLRKQGLKVFYTAHGFHFYKGAPLKNWLLFYPAEKLCALMTDVLITINREDYALARKKFHPGRVEYVPGVGLDLERFRIPDFDREARRRELGLTGENVVLLSVGELNENKNQAAVIRALGRLKDPRVRYLIVGRGSRKDNLLELARKENVSDQVQLLGFRTDTPELYRMADLFVHPSLREGLPVALMEAMASGLPVACSRVRGNVDLVDNAGGVLFDPNSTESVETALRKLLAIPEAERESMAEHNRETVQKFGNDVVLERLKQIYMPEQAEKRPILKELTY